MVRVTISVARHVDTSGRSAAPPASKTRLDERGDQTLCARVLAAGERSRVGDRCSPEAQWLTGLTQ